MKINSLITFILGVVLVVFGVIMVIKNICPIPLFVGLALCYLGWKGGRIAIIIFGHTCVVIGCYLITWGIYLLPHCKPIPAHIFGRPLFWGMFSLLGGVCAIYHGFCNCIVGKKVK